ncbi:MAG: 2-succinyl-5-enolpyruvyl-6-hydroxy-3-cyclohexene-1-carboxylic-acid synthase [Parachlamydiaceae bacterium]|nr:2-succinyl-5-enolpyruvyl-6-hydroxy-3-cyclohexene-1-carboxylic-acid synthase [Parachlamydiaceae bacterium]
MNEQLARQVIEEAVKSGVTEFCVCPGNRNAPLYSALMNEPSLKKYFWYEERSAAFFALGRARALRKPVAVVTTSGTAAGELLPATMEAHHTGDPLLLITADRPRRFRGSGAPQTCDQVGLYGAYSGFQQDVAHGDICSLDAWSRLQPAHLNVCFEEPFPAGKAVLQPSQSTLMAVNSVAERVRPPIPHQAFAAMDQFLDGVDTPLVVVSALKSEARSAVLKFLLQLNAPVFFEGVSGLREEPTLQHLRVRRTDGLWACAEKAGYPIDGILRIGGVPTFRLWRDVEEREGKIAVCSISDVPFSGISWADVLHVPVEQFFSQYAIPGSFQSAAAERWLESEKRFGEQLHELFSEEPCAEPSLIHHLSRQMPIGAQVYVGNSLPIREWDLAASDQKRGFEVTASRGLNGIDGQMSTFFGLSAPHRANWGIFGDLTTLYDLAGPWILPQLHGVHVNVVVVNNGGGQIFAKFRPDREFLNAHELQFAPIAEMWKMHYERWDKVPEGIVGEGNRLIEIVPDARATVRFAKRLAGI